MARASGPPGPNEVQLRLEPVLTLEQYVKQRAWETASLSSCPLHPAGGCGYRRHGTYLRKFPMPLPVARFYCASGHTTISLLPDFLASRLPGTLDEVEQAAVVAEAAASREQAAEQLRPAAAPDAVTLESAKRWTSRRVTAFAAVLVAVVGLLPERFVGVRTAAELRARLGTEQALMALRGIATPWLGSLPPPLGFSPRLVEARRRGQRLQHNSGPDPPRRVR
jgi:hypothetical protein